MNVDAGALVVSEVIAGVIWIVIDDDFVAIPIPPVYICIVGLGDTEVEAIEPEAVRASSAESPHMARAETRSKASVFPGVVKVIMYIAPARVMANPAIPRIDVGRFGVTRMIIEPPIFFPRRVVYRRRPVLRGLGMIVSRAPMVAVVVTIVSTVLSERERGTNCKS